MKDRLLSKRRPLITSPLRVADDRGACAHPVIPVLAERGGRSSKSNNGKPRLGFKSFLTPITERPFIERGENLHWFQFSVSAHVPRLLP